MRSVSIKTRAFSATARSVKNAIVAVAFAGAIGLGLAYSAVAQDRKHRFERMDTDSNGGLSFEEFAGNSESRSERMDTNGDGAITKDEFVTFRGERAFQRRGRIFDKLDSNGDGEITVEERAEIQRGRFEKIDANGDGEITRAEAREARKRFAAAKRDRRQNAE